MWENQGIHRELTLNILGDLSGHGRNGGGERHLWRSWLGGPVGGRGLLRRRCAARRGRHQHRAAHAADAGTLCTGTHLFS